MSDSGRVACPECGRECHQVPLRAVTHQVRQPWQLATEQRYYFCDHPACPLVYFGDAGARLDLNDLRGEVGQKCTDPARPVCYCYGVDASQAADPAVRAFVVAETRAGRCACETRNPSGRCCLGDFPEDERGE